MTKALSSYWASHHHHALGSTTDDAIRLAIALSAARSVVRVVDRSQPPMTVDWSAYDPEEDKGQSYTDFQNGHIRLNPAPILGTVLDHGDALDVTSAFALHEASHSQESRDRYKYLIRRVEIAPPAPVAAGASIEGHAQFKRDARAYRELLAQGATVIGPNGRPMRDTPAFEPMRIAAYLWNIVEDIRIERATSDNWPGFEPYFDRLVEWLWSGLRKDLHMADLLFASKVEDRLKIVFMACRFGDQGSDLVRSWKTTAKAEKQLLGEMAWWRSWQADYLSDRIDTPTTIQRGLDHLTLDPETAKELDQMKAEEREEREAGEKLRAQIDRLLREGVAGAFDICSMGSGEMVPLDAETARKVTQYIKEGLAEVKTIIIPEGREIPSLIVRKPIEDAKSKRAYVGRPNAESEALRAALVFRQSAPEYTERLLKEGQIDDDEIWRWATGDNRIFGQRVIESKPDVFMGLLVDLSGSMEGEKLRIAQRLAQLFVWAVHDQEGIATRVWGHTASTSTTTGAEVFRLWEQGDPLTRLGLIDTLEHSANADGTAIEYCVTQIASEEQPEKVLLVLSDGLPSVPGGSYGREHVRRVVRWAESRGVRVHQIAIDPGALRPEHQAAMYGEGNWTGFTSYAALPRQIAALLGRYL